MGLLDVDVYIFNLDNRDRPPYVSDYRGRGGYDRGPSRDYDRGYDRNYDSRPPTDRYDRYDSGGYAPPPDRYGAPYDRYRDYNERGPDRYPPRGGGYGDRGASRPPYRDERRYDERPQYDRGPPPPQDRRPRSPPNY